MVEIKVTGIKDSAGLSYSETHTFKENTKVECFKKIFRKYCRGRYSSNSFVVGDPQQNREFWEWEEHLPLDEYLDLHDVLIK